MMKVWFKCLKFAVSSPPPPPPPCKEGRRKLTEGFFFLIDKYSKSFGGILIWNAGSLKGSLALVSAAASLIKANIESDKIYMDV